MIQAAGREGFHSLQTDALGFARRNRLLQLHHDDTGTNVDVALGFIPFELETIERRIWVTIVHTQAPIPTVEDLIIMKCVSGRLQDLADVETLLQMNDRIDLKRIRDWLHRFEQMMDRADILAEFERLKTGSRRGTR